MRLISVLVLLAACSTTTEPTAPEPVAEPIVTPAPEPEVEPDTEAATPKLNLNTATEEELHTIPGMTDRMAHEFDEYRPYVSISQFRREMSKYVDDATIAGYEQYIYVPIAANDCDAATLAQLPGVDAAAAELLIAARPFDADSFVAALTAAGKSDAAAVAADWTTW